MNIPPPHEFSRPVSPSMTPSPPPVAQLPAPVAMPVPHRVREDDDTDSDPNIHVISSTPPNEYLPDEHEGGGYGYPSSRDYAYSYPHPYEERNFSGSGSGSGGSGRSSGGGRGGGGGGPNVVIPIAHNASIGTPQSRSSTRISQYDIVGPPRAGGGSRMRGDSRSATVPVPPPPPALNPGPRMSSREFGPGSRMTPPAERQRQSPVPPLPVIPPSSSQYQQHQGRMTETPASSLTKVERSSTPQRTPRNDVSVFLSLHSLSVCAVTHSDL